MSDKKNQGETSNSWTRPCPVLPHRSIESNSRRRCTNDLAHASQVVLDGGHTEHDRSVTGAPPENSVYPSGASSTIQQGISGVERNVTAGWCTITRVVLARTFVALLENMPLHLRRPRTRSCRGSANPRCCPCSAQSSLTFLSGG